MQLCLNQGYHEQLGRVCTAQVNKLHAYHWPCRLWALVSCLEPRARLIRRPLFNRVIYYLLKFLKNKMRSVQRASPKVVKL